MGKIMHDKSTAKISQISLEIDPKKPIAPPAKSTVYRFKKVKGT